MGNAGRAAAVAGGTLLVVLSAVLLVGGRGNEGSTPDAKAQGPARVVVPGVRSVVEHEMAIPAPSPGPELTCATTIDAPLQPPADRIASPAFRAQVAMALDIYERWAVDYTVQLQEYSSTGNYLNYGNLQNYEDDPTLQIDERGMPMVEYGGTFYYNPVTASQWVLTRHGQYVEGKRPLEEFVAAADALITLQSPDGAFRMPFPHSYYLTGELFEPGWVSGLAHGQAISALSRAYRVTGEARFRSAAEAAFAFMITPRTEGGTRSSLASVDPSLEGFVTFQEVPTEVDTHTLNGFLYAMLGLYDWWQVDPAATSGSTALARDYFECSLATVLLTLPLYDMDGFSSYDLGYLFGGEVPNLQAAYHALHISLLHVLHGITGIDEFRVYEERWTGYVEGLRH